jgi:hypothetical protein
MKQKFSLVCDEVRQEVGGKLIIIGVYTPDIGVPQIPFSLPTLTFVNWAETDRPGDFHYQMRLTHLETGQTVVQGAMGIRCDRPGPVILPVRLTNVPIVGPGAFVFSLHMDGQDDMLTQFTVQIILPTQQQGAGTPRMGH